MRIRHSFQAMINRHAEWQKQGGTCRAGNNTVVTLIGHMPLALGKEEEMKRSRLFKRNKLASSNVGGQPQRVGYRDIFNVQAEGWGFASN